MLVVILIALYNDLYIPPICWALVVLGIINKMLSLWWRKE